MDQLVRRQAAIRTGGRAAEQAAGIAAESPAGPVSAPGPKADGSGAEPAAAAAVPAAVPAACCAVQKAAEVLSRPVRRRGKELERAIFEAALDQLTSGGFARLTMEGVAAAARTGKAALYRRWASKVELVIDALDSTLPRPTDTPDLGSTRRELLLLIEGFAGAINSRAGGAMQALMGELDHEQAELFKDFIIQRVIVPTRSTIVDILRRGIERGEVRAGADTSMAVDVAPAMLMYRVKTCGRQFGPEFAVELVDDVLVPMIRP
ncbi:TetR-like C-terminal domain-containing protein [Kitasatospora sp. NPDC090091]|uniref:TetR-like C-terminal domain-containing protein n=1 Tax=Kitasatospora sp. NPDC090091 TaxID=3364081 RepID=UPI003806FF53